MLHPQTELKFVSEAIGYGIFATELIPKGTIMWVRDELDRVIKKEDLANYSPANLENLLKYTYRTAEGDYFFCWDLNRYVNHSFQPNSMITPLGFEIAIRDIQPGEEVTNDYGTLNVIEAFVCAKDTDHERSHVYPDDLARHYQAWDKKIAEAFQFIMQRPQPLERLLTKGQKEEIEKIHRGEMDLPSIKNNLYLGS